MYFSKIAIAAGWTLVAASSQANAAPVVPNFDGQGAFSTPNTVTFSTPSQQIWVRHTFGVNFTNFHDTVAPTQCGAKITFGDGFTVNVLTQYPTETVSAQHAYTGPASHEADSTRTATVEGFAHSGKIACNGSGSTTLLVYNTIPRMKIKFPPLK